MAAFPRLASVSVASAVALGLVVPIVGAPPAVADPCAQTVPALTPNTAAAPNTAAPRASGPVQHIPTGRKPAGAQDQAPLPEVGPLPAAAPDPAAPGSAPKQNQAGVVPRPNPPEPPNQRGPNAAAQAPAGPAPAAAAATSPSTSIAGWLNGPKSETPTGNQTLERFGISGADLGIIWDNGDPNNHQSLIAFGDTFGDCSTPNQQWRSNTMFRSGDPNLSDGIQEPIPTLGDLYGSSPLLRSNFSKQIIDSPKIAQTEVTIIPTAGISVGKTQYVNFMSVKQWGNPGQWTTNFSALAVSTNNGENWTVNRSTVRNSSGGNANFQQGAFVRRDGYVYSFGTPAGRSGSAYVSRVPEGSVQDLTKYEYWSKPWWNFWGSGSWVKNNPSGATAVISAPVSEMSVAYNEYLKKYVALYCNGANNVVMRTASAPQGPWSSTQTLVTATQIPGGLYAPFIHPWSTGKDLYFNLSLWSAYSVMLMHTVLP